MSIEETWLAMNWIYMFHSRNYNPFNSIVAVTELWWETHEMDPLFWNEPLLDGEGC